MIQHLTILLNSNSTSFCHYTPQFGIDSFISIENLKKGILFAMKKNLMIQYVYPSYGLPRNIKDELETIDHIKIIPADSPLIDDADIVVINGINKLEGIKLKNDCIYVLRLTKEELAFNYKRITSIVSNVSRLNLCITDVDVFTEKDVYNYSEILKEIAKPLINAFCNDGCPQLNILTDCLQLTTMNNCNAGCENITLAPDGNFYVCPAFYYEEGRRNMKYGNSSKHPMSIGSLNDGLHIGNAHLYRIDKAPICRNCDAYQCRRCIWLNLKKTNEVNTPSREQCMIAHVERNASRRILCSVRERIPDFLLTRDIPEIDYLDPFDVCKR